MMASREGHKDVVELLLLHNALVDLQNDVSHLFHQDRPPPHIVSFEDSQQLATYRFHRSTISFALSWVTPHCCVMCFAM